MQLDPVRHREAHVCQPISFGLIQEGRELWQLGTQLIGDQTPLGARGRGIVTSNQVGVRIPTLPANHR